MLFHRHSIRRRRRRRRPAPQVFQFPDIPVDEDADFDEIAAACGFKWVADMHDPPYPMPRLRSEFMRLGSGPYRSPVRKIRRTAAMAVVFFNWPMVIDRVRTDIEAMGLRPATIRELLAFTKAEPRALSGIERETGHYIEKLVALGSTRKDQFGDRNSPCLGRDHDDGHFLSETGTICWMEGFYGYLTVR